MKSEQFALHIEFEAPAGHLLVGSHAHDDMHACVAAQASHFVFLLPAFNFLLPLFLAMDADLIRRCQSILEVAKEGEGLVKSVHTACTSWNPEDSSTTSHCTRLWWA